MCAFTTAGQGVTLLCQTEVQSLLRVAQPEFLNPQQELGEGPNAREWQKSVRENKAGRGRGKPALTDDDLTS